MVAKTYLQNVLAVPMGKDCSSKTKLHGCSQTKVQPLVVTLAHFAALRLAAETMQRPDIRKISLLQIPLQIVKTETSHAGATTETCDMPKGVLLVSL